MRGDLIITKGIYSLHIDWVGGLYGKVFDSRRCMTVRHDQEQSIFSILSCLAWLNSVDDYFIIWSTSLKMFEIMIEACFFIFILPFCNYYTSEEIKKELHIYTYDIAEDLAWGEETHRETMRLMRVTGFPYYITVRYQFYGVI